MKKCMMIIIALLILSCNKLKEGSVIDKHYEPQRTYMQMMPMCISTGKSTTIIFIPYFVTDNEDWVVTIKGKYKNKERVEDVYVNQKQYECLQNGDHFIIGKDCSLKDDNNYEESICTNGTPKDGF